MESTGAWTVGSRKALEAPGLQAAAGLQAAESLASVASSMVALGRIIGPDYRDRTDDRNTADGSDVAGDGDSDPLRRRVDACLEALAEVARLEAKTAALKVQLAAAYVDASTAIASPALTAQEATAQEMSTIAEVACVLTISERTAGALLSECHALTTLPLTLSALQAGSISWQHARIVVDETTNLDPAGAKALEAHFLDPDAPNPARGCPAGDLVPGRFRTKARTWRERHHPVSIEKRHAKGAQDRRLDYTPDRDGMAWLSAYLPADQAAGIWARTTTAARAVQGPHETRTLSQLRADLAATWLLTSNTIGDTAGGGTGGAGTGGGGAKGRTGTGIGMVGGVPSPTAQVLITVPVLSLLGTADEPATLDGYGPIPPSMARRLVSDGSTSFLRVLTDPRDGAPLEIGRTSYRITKAMRQWLRLRDGKCPFPGCNNHSLDNEADHLLAWANGGTTGITNLGQPCPKHHRLKHGTSWTPTRGTKNEPPGWTAPSGRHYPSEQQDWQPPSWPHHIRGPGEHPDVGVDAVGVDAVGINDADMADVGMADVGMADVGMELDEALPTDPFPEWWAWPAPEAEDRGWRLPADPSPDELWPALAELPVDPLRDRYLLQPA